MPQSLAVRIMLPELTGKRGYSVLRPRITINEDLRTVITEGTGTQASAAGVTLAGKTGTAEIKASQDDTTGTELGWFAAYEIDNTQDPVLIIMMVEDVKDRDGSHYVVPKVAEAFRIYRSQTPLEGN